MSQILVVAHISITTPAENLTENSGKYFILAEKPGKLRENVRCVT